VIHATNTGLTVPRHAERILILVARPFLTANHIDSLRELLRGPVDWNQVLNGSIRNLILHLTRKNLKAHAGDLLPVGLDQLLNYHSRQAVLRQMEIVRTQKHIASDLLLPQRVDHAFIKGSTLSDEYYGDPYLRQYRDIDILMGQEAVFNIGSALLREGYEVTNSVWDGMPVADLSALAQYCAVLEVRSPAGISVELHQRLDHSGCVFKMDVLSHARRKTLGFDFEGSVLPFAYHYVYAIFHHSRHRWSSLHWVADLAAMGRLAKENQREIVPFAEQCGLLPTLQQSLLLEQNLDAFAVSGTLPTAQTRSAFFADCMVALTTSTMPHDGVAIGIDNDDRREPDFPYAWQKTVGYKLNFQLNRIHPTLDDFNAIPLPRRWRWLLYATKPFRVAVATVRRREL
jgi:hypothetical protein